MREIAFVEFCYASAYRPIIPIMLPPPPPIPIDAFIMDMEELLLRDDSSGRLGSAVKVGARLGDLLGNHVGMADIVGSIDGMLLGKVVGNADTLGAAVFFVLFGFFFILVFAAFI